ncbi:MAG: helix-turn-helix transcriptional regulator [Ruminococcaceae bacterium]|nr:helix-turn-helix transcriptional regulator [Oscillospiraceae bacterium]
MLQLLHKEVIFMSIDFLSNLYVCEIPFVTVYNAEKTDYPMKNNGRYHCGMLYTVNGSEIYRFSDGTVRTQPDSVLVIPKNEEYIIEFEGEKGLVITVDFEIPDDVLFRPFVVKFEKNNAVRRIFSDMEKEWRKKAIDSAVLNKSNLYRIASFLVRRMNTYSTSVNMKKIHMATEYLHANCLERDFRIETLSKMCSVSRRYFEKMFFDVHNMSPKEYMINYKLSLAKELLLSERSSVTYIAERLGYSDIYHFSKAFKNRVGYSPTEFKRIFCEGGN